MLAAGVRWARPGRGPQGGRARAPSLPAVGSFGHEPGPGDADEAPERGEDDYREGEGVRRHGERRRPRPGAAAPERGEQGWRRTASALEPGLRMRASASRGGWGGAGTPRSQVPLALIGCRGFPDLQGSGECQIN